MASKWTKNVAAAGMLSGSIYAVVVFIDPARGMVERLRVRGEPRPINLARLRAKSGGRITEIGAREGQSVKAGDVLVRFENEDIQSSGSRDA